MSTEQPINGQDEQDPLAQFKKELAIIESRFSSPELLAGYKKFMATKGYVVAKPGRNRNRASAEPGQHFAKQLKISPDFIVPAEKHLVRYFLMQALRITGHDIVLHEFNYMRSIADVLAVVSGRAIEFEIKASRDDYFADFRKTIYKGMGKPLSKHGLLAKGGTMISKFYFVLPENMIDRREWPAHAGIILYGMQGDVPIFRVAKYPPLLTKQYLSPNSWQTISKRLQIRNWSLCDRYENNKFASLQKHTLYASRYVSNQSTNIS